MHENYIIVMKLLKCFTLCKRFRMVLYIHFTTKERAELNKVMPLNLKFCL